MNIRLERPEDYRVVEELTREAFGMCISRDVWSIMYLISIGTILTLFRSWTM